MSRGLRIVVILLGAWIGVSFLIAVCWSIAANVCYRCAGPTTAGNGSHAMRRNICLDAVDKLVN